MYLLSLFSAKARTLLKIFTHLHCLYLLNCTQFPTLINVRSRVVT
jgi:hypothetical protein